MGEKTNRDHTIKSMNDEITNQDEVINKLNKEKKHISENGAKSAEDLQIATEKVEHLLKVKAKLEATLDELESSFEKEKRSRGAIDKERRKIEGDLKVCQETVADLERSKKELEAALMRRENEIGGQASKLDDEQGLVGKVQKGIKELQGRVEELEEELEAERQSRAKAERQRSDMAREIDQLGERLDEAGGATAAQVELNKKREAEVGKLRKDIEEANIQQEAVLGNSKRKQGDATGEMSEQVDTLQKIKARIDKDKIIIMNEIGEARGATDEVTRAQASVDKSNHNMLDNLNAINKRVDAANLTLGDYAASKNKIANENGDYMRVVGDLENNLNILAKSKSSIGAQLNDVKALCDDVAG